MIIKHYYQLQTNGGLWFFAIEDVVWYRFSRQEITDEDMPDPNNPKLRMRGKRIADICAVKLLGGAEIHMKDEDAIGMKMLLTQANEAKHIKILEATGKGIVIA